MEILKFLLNNAITAACSALVMLGILWIAKRGEKQGKGTKLQANMDFQPFSAELDRLKSELKKLAETQKAKEKQAEAKKPPKPPTTGSNAIKPKERKYDGFSALEYAIQKAQSVNLDEWKAKFEALKTEPVKIFHSCGGALKNGIEVKGGYGNRISVIIPADKAEEEKAKPGLPVYCGNCAAHRQERFDGNLNHVCMRNKVFIRTEERWNNGCEGHELAPEWRKWYTEWYSGFCGKCAYFEPDEPGQKRGSGLCGMKEEIVLMGESCPCFQRKGEMPKFFERQPMNPAPLGTDIAH